MSDTLDELDEMANAVVITEIKLKQNKRKTMFCFSEIVLFQFYLRFNHCLTDGVLVNVGSFSIRV